MVKFVLKRNHRDLIGLGISEANIYKLREGLPIYVNGSEIGLKFDIEIFYGKDEKELMEIIKPYIGKKTKIEPE